MTKLTYENIKDHLISNLTEAQIVKNLKTISSTFTVEREKIQKLYENAQMVASYACFYLPTNAWKLKFLLERLSKDQVDEIKQSIVIEIGTGPGTYLLAFMDILGPELTSFIGIDHNPLMLEQAVKITQNLFPTADVEWRSAIPDLSRFGSDKKITLIFGNSLNEMGSLMAFKIIQKVKPHNIILIEPGTMTSFSEVLKLRTNLLTQNYHVQYPCGSDGACPISELSKEDWCHQVVRTSLDESTQRLSQMISLDRTIMPAVIHFYSASQKVQVVQAHIVRLVKILKHAFLWEVCTNENGQLVIISIEVPKKLMTKKEVKEFGAISTGLGIDYEVDKIIGDGVVRVKNFKVYF